MFPEYIYYVIQPYINTTWHEGGFQKEQEPDGKKVKLRKEGCLWTCYYDHHQIAVNVEKRMFPQDALKYMIQFNPVKPQSVHLFSVLPSSESIPVCCMRFANNLASVRP